MNFRIIFMFTIMISTFICATTSENEYLCYCLDQHSNKDKFCVLKTSSINEIILTQNRYTRADLSTGLLLRNYLKATNMLTVKWDEELAQKAQQYANDCPMSQDMQRERTQNGFYHVQNFAIKEYDVQPGSIDYFIKNRFLRIRRVLKEWKQEPKFGSEEKELDGKSNRTNMIRSSTWKVGCGIGVSAKESEGKYREHYVCYFETGELNDEKPLYKLGCELCNDCPIGTSCDKADFIGLCRVTGEIPNISPEVDGFHDIDSCKEVEEPTLDQTLIWQCNNWKSQNCIIKEMCASSWDIEKVPVIKMRYGPFEDSTATFLFYKMIYLEKESCYSFRYEYRMKTKAEKKQLAIIAFPNGDVTRFLWNVMHPDGGIEETISLYLPWIDTHVQVGVSFRSSNVDEYSYPIEVKDFKIIVGKCRNPKK